MKRKVLMVFFIGAVLFIFYLYYCNSERFYSIKDNSACSTFLFNKNDTVIIAHNLDDYIEVPGAVFINKRDVLKESISWTDFTCMCAKKMKNTRIQWVSKYGSVTYNTWGKDFIDGGMNEQGLYIGEMTLLGTSWLESQNPAFHHHFFMQYVLDNFRTTEEVISILDNIRIDGHCQWHYFVADKYGNTAVIEFLNEKMNIYEGEQMPVRVLCNRAYDKELKLLPDNDSIYNLMLENEYVSKDLRFMLAAKKIDEYNEKTGISSINYAFSILKEMDMGNNRWSVVYDLTNGKMFFRTSLGQEIKFIDFKSLDFNCNTPVRLFDIKSDVSGDVTNKFVDYSPELNEEFIQKNFDEINFGEYFSKILLYPYTPHLHLWFFGRLCRIYLCFIDCFWFRCFFR